MSLDLSSSPQVTFIGALPPPVTGMTAMTEVIVDAFSQRTNVRRFNWSRGKPLMGWRWRAARVWGAATAFVGLAWMGPARGGTLYYPVSSGAGLYYDLAIVLLGRILGYRLILHHHVYSYITRHDWRVACLDRLVGATGAHAVHCELMRQHFLTKYKSRATFLFVPPSVVSQDLEIVPPEPRAQFTLGFLSNLSISKGLDEVIATFESLAKQGRNVKLILAGPCAGREEVRLVDKAVAQWPDRVEYRGAVYGPQKSQFFSDIDVFLFPTRYRNESWGIVLTEALACGCPVIARSRGCIPWIVRHGCGLVTPPDGEFVSPAVELLTTWIEAPELHREARARALQRSRELHEDARRQLPEFVEAVVAANAGRLGSIQKTASPDLEVG